MVDEKRIIAEIESQIDSFRGISDEYKDRKQVCSFVIYALISIKDYIKTLSEEKVSEDLDSAVDNYMDRKDMALRLDWRRCDISFTSGQLMRFADYVAQWQKEKTWNEIKEWLKEKNERDYYTFGSMLKEFDELRKDIEG